MTISDPYKILGIPKNASDDEIKKAFRKLAHQHHPDKKGGNSAKFKEVNEAYQVLSDPAKRKQYDNYGFAGNGNYSGQNQGFGGNPFSGGFGGFSTGSGGFEDIFDLFGNAFGGGQSYGTREAAKGEDIYAEVSINKKDLGTTKVFEFAAHLACKECNGSGVAKGYGLKDCSTCKGQGRVQQSVRTPFGTFSQVVVCTACKGKRKLPEKKCANCGGIGRVDGKKKVEIHIPAEIEDGYNIVFPKQGNAGKEGKPPGDLLMVLKVKKGIFG